VAESRSPDCAPERLLRGNRRVVREKFLELRIRRGHSQWFLESGRSVRWGGRRRPAHDRPSKYKCPVAISL